jgi:hypothetical protein
MLGSMIDDDARGTVANIVVGGVVRLPRSSDAPISFFVSDFLRSEYVVVESSEKSTKW